MTLSSLLKPEAVRVLSSIPSKKRLMRAVAETAGECYGVDVDSALAALLDRESVGPTGVGHGVALPHARLADLDEVSGVFLRLDKPIAFDAVDRRPVDLVFGLFAPEDCGVTHLRALATVSRALRNPKLQQKLRANDEPTVLHAILSDPAESKAA